MQKDKNWLDSTAYKTYQILIENNVLPALARPLAKRLTFAMGVGHCDDDHQSSIRSATYTSVYDDGSRFESPCVIDIDAKTVLETFCAGNACDDAACSEQYVTYGDTEYHVYDPDMDDECLDEYYTVSDMTAYALSSDFDGSGIK